LAEVGYIVDLPFVVPNQALNRTIKLVETVDECALLLLVRHWKPEFF
jgi:hypothetical protein